MARSPEECPDKAARICQEQGEYVEKMDILSCHMLRYQGLWCLMVLVHWIYANLWVESLPDTLGSWGSEALSEFGVCCSSGQWAFRAEQKFPAILEIDQFTVGFTLGSLGYLGSLTKFGSRVQAWICLDLLLPCSQHCSAQNVYTVNMQTVRPSVCRATWAMNGNGVCVASATWAKYHNSKALRLITAERAPSSSTLSLECPQNPRPHWYGLGSCVQKAWGSHFWRCCHRPNGTATCSNSMPWCVCRHRHGKRTGRMPWQTGGSCVARRASV